MRDAPHAMRQLLASCSSWMLEVYVHVYVIKNDGDDD